MKRIELSKITVEDDKILYEVRQDSGVELLRQDITQLFIRLHCAENVKVSLGRVPQSILAVPISLYLLPLTYFYKIELVLPVMDKVLYEKLPEIYAAYSEIYGPFSEDWRGKLIVESVVNTPTPQTETYDKVVFFSGGVDACSAGVNNPGRKTILVSIPDIELNAKNEGPLREEKFSLIDKFSKVIGSDWALISNNFNVSLYRDIEINNYLRMTRGLHGPAFDFDGWAGIKYIANMCSVAPLAHAFGVKSLIMGSAFEQFEKKCWNAEDGASPVLSSSIAFAGVRFAEQDEIRTRRSTKVRKIIEWCNRRNKKVKLWTCFRDESTQCGLCRKCIRTQLNILCVGENPKDWGFDNFDEKKFSRLIKSYGYLDAPCWHWDIDDVIDAQKAYSYCNDMLHWLKRIGYKKYRIRALARIGRPRRIAWLKKLLLINRYPHYLKSIIKRLMK